MKMRKNKSLREGLATDLSGRKGKGKTPRTPFLRLPGGGGSAEAPILPIAREQFFHAIDEKKKKKRRAGG